MDVTGVSLLDFVVTVEVFVIKDGFAQICGTNDVNEAGVPGEFVGIKHVVGMDGLREHPVYA